MSINISNSRFLTEEEFEPFRRALNEKLGPKFNIWFLSGNGMPVDPGFTLACKITYEGNPTAKSIVSGLALATLDEPSVRRWAVRAARDIKKAFGINPPRRI
jgi:hypothetical protein